jgi:pimeloyl-ACP methyl ester carboxylesterase
LKRHSPVRRIGFAAKLLLLALAVVAAVSVMMHFLQDQLLFPTNAVPAAGPLPPTAERLEIEALGGVRLHGIHFPPRNPGNNPLVLGFGGNAWNGQHVAMELNRLFPDAHVIAFHYRGYRPSTGSPSAQALMADAPLVFDAAIARTKPTKVVAVGFSIGSGVAAHLAGERKLDGLILVTPFDSLKAAASDLFPWLPLGAFFQHEMNAAAALKGNRVPVALIAAERDEIIRPGRTAALRRQVPNLIFDHIVTGVGHNDIYGRADFEEAMHKAYFLIVSKKKQV